LGRASDIPSRELRSLRSLAHYPFRECRLPVTSLRLRPSV
jgi:hypothetical protein